MIFTPNSCSPCRASVTGSRNNARNWAAALLTVLFLGLWPGAALKGQAPSKEYIRLGGRVIAIENSGVPPAPTGLTATAGNTQVSLSWTASSGAVSYNVYRGTSSRGEGTNAVATGITATPYTDSSLTNGTPYYYTVAAVSSSGTSPQSNEASATPQAGVPLAPIGLTATAGNAQVSLSWTASSGATSYNVYRGTAAGGEAAAAFATGITTTSYTDTSAANGTTYYYKVAAVNGSGNSPQSNEAYATPQSGATASFMISRNGGAFTQSVTANVGDTITYQWSSSDGASYAFYDTIGPNGSDGCGNTTGPTTFTPAAGGTSGLNTLVSCQAGYTYTMTYTVTPASGTAATATISISVGQAAPAAPTGLTAAVGNSQVTLNWAASSGATSYNVYRGTAAGGEGTSPIATGITLTSYTDTSLTTSGTYYYKVAAVGSSRGVSALSNEAYATVQVSTPAAPTGLTAVGYNASVALSWYPSTGATSYNVYRGTASGTETLLVSGVTTYIYTDNTVSNGTTYWYQVAAVNAAGTSGRSTEYAATPEAGVPSTPTGLAATMNAGIYLTWNASSGATGYSLSKGTVSGGETFLFADPVTYYTDHSATLGATYYYQVQASNANGLSARSAEIAVTISPAAPTLTATAGNAQVTLSWTAPSGATSYSVYRGTASGGETQLTAGVTAASYTDTGVMNGKTYYYKVAAVNAGGPSAYSNQVSFDAGGTTGRSDRTDRHGRQRSGELELERQHRCDVLQRLPWHDFGR